MTLEIGRVRAAEADDVFRLLVERRLPLEGLREHLATTLVARQDGQIVGSAAIEVYADGGLLRSVAVAPDLQGQRVGRQLTEAALDLALEHRLPAVYLLTETAADYFPRFGFERIARADVPPGVQTSIEFTSVCPSSATVMRKRLAGR
jgi:amino-acid N-acetyltransferase